MKIKLDLSQNNLICGDAKDWLPFIPSNSIDLIYIDPPFFSNKNYEIIWGNGFELRSFGDRWKGGINHYIGWMRPKIIEAHRVLKPTGSILLHCDKNANHHLRILLDEIFGENNFKNEIIWHYYNGSCNSKLFFGNKHDNIYFYSKGKINTFNIDKARVPHNEGSAWIKNKKKGKFNPKWGIPNPKGKKRDDVFKIPTINNMAKERIGYRTQKPEVLISILLEVLSNENDIILDFFGGGGTTAKVAGDLSRRWITGDISPVAYRVIKERLNQAGHIDFIDCNPPLTREEWRLIDGHIFAKRVCEYMGWEVNPKKSGDGGIDGWANGRKSAVQIKNSDVQVSVIRDLAGVCSVGKYKHGICVGWTFSKGCYEFTAKLEKDTGIKIELSQADFIVKPISNIKKEEYQALYSERVKAHKQKVQFLKTY